MIKTGGYGDYQICVAEHLVRLGKFRRQKSRKILKELKGWKTII
jgi:hypothetical protein